MGNVDKSKYADRVFHFIVHRAEEGGFWGEVVELPGAMSQGETEEELERNMRDALLAVLESYAEDGEDPPFEDYVRTQQMVVSI